MMDLNDFTFFAAVVQHGGFTAAARATGIDKARLSRHVATLEERLGARLLQRTTRSVGLTEAGQRFYAGCLAVMEGARAACEGVQELQKEPSGLIRIGCPVVLAHNYLAPLLPGFLAANPKVSVEIEASDRVLHPLEEHFDVILCTPAGVPDSTSLVAREVGRVRRILVAGRGLDSGAMPAVPEDLADRPIIARLSETHDGIARWDMQREDGETRRLQIAPRLASTDLHVQLEAARQGTGIALLPEPIAAAGLQDGSLRRVLPAWFAPEYSLYLVYPTPRGMLPSVRGFIDYLLSHMPVNLAPRL